MKRGPKPRPDLSVVRIMLAAGRHPNTIHRVTGASSGTIKAVAKAMAPGESDG